MPRPEFFDGLPCLKIGKEGQRLRNFRDASFIAKAWGMTLSLVVNFF
jgi:hypothetical protein